MAKKPIKDISDLELPEEEQVLDSTEEVEESAEVKELKKIEEVLSDAEVSGGTVRLERKGPNDFKWQYCGRLKVEDFSVDHIKQVYGGGDYRAQTFRAKGAFYKKFEFTIDYRHRGTMDVASLPLVDKSGEKSAEIQATIAASTQNTSMSMMMTMMDRAAQQQNSQMVMMMNMMNETSKQNIAMMSGMFTALSAAMGKPQADPSAAMMPLLIEMVRSGSGKGGSDITQVISAVRDLSALAKGEPAPKEEKEDGMLDKVLKYGGPIVTALLTRTPIPMPGAVAPKVDGSPVIDINQAQAAAQPQALPPQVDPAQADMLQKINTYMEVLIGAAERESDPATYAELVSDMLTDEHFNVLMTELKSPDWFTKLASGNPRIIARQAWFTQLREELLLMTNEQSATTESNVQSATGTGN